jgi:UrcA family protein
MFTRSIRVAVLAGTVAAATTGLAVSAVYAEPVAHVRFSDLDLRSPIGQKMLTRRISIAADRICEQGTDVLTTQRCRSDTMTQARERVRAATGQGL